MTRLGAPEPAIVEAGPRARMRLLAAVLAACGLGALGLWWAVAGGGPAATVRGRVVTSALFFLATGGVTRLVLGRHRRRLDWLLIPVVASGPLVLGGTGIALALEGGRPGGDLPLALVYVTVPLALAAAGWALGGRVPGGQAPDGGEPGGREPGGREPGGREPGGREPGGRLTERHDGPKRSEPRRRR